MDALKCGYCGVRRLLRLDVFGTNGANLVETGEADVVVQCPSCHRVFKVVTGDDNVASMQPLLNASTMVTLRTL